MQNKLWLGGNNKLIFIIEYDSMTGGMLHSVYSLIQQLKLSYDIHVICPEGDLENKFRADGVKVITIKNMNFWHSKRVTTRISLLFLLFKTIKKLAGKRSIVITNNIYSQLLVSICSYFCSFKFVYFNRGGNLSNKISKLVILLSSHLDLVIATSSNQQKIVEKSGLIKKGARSLVLFNPVNRFDNKMLRTSSTSTTFIIGIVGFIDRGKNQLLAIEAMAKLINKGINLHLYIYGEANNNEYFTLLKHRILELKLTKHIFFKGFTSNKVEIYSNINLLLSTSISEGFGRTLVEAMLAKKPVVALKIAGGPLDIITSKKFGILAENNVESVVVSIEKFIVDEKYTEMVVNNAFEYALNKFSPESIGLEFVSILERENL